MPLNKIQYTDDVTVIPASNLNDIQDEVIANGTASISAKNEVEDIRTGADGTTYTTAGDAVRGQIDDVKDDLKNLEYKYTDWKQGIIGSETGEPASNNYSVYSDAFSIEEFKSCAKPINYRLRYFVYDENGLYIEHKSTTYTISATITRQKVLMNHPRAKYVRFDIQLYDEGVQTTTTPEIVNNSDVYLNLLVNISTYPDTLKRIDDIEDEYLDTASITKDLICNYSGDFNQGTLNVNTGGYSSTSSVAVRTREYIRLENIYSVHIDNKQVHFFCYDKDFTFLGRHATNYTDYTYADAEEILTSKPDTVYVKIVFGASATPVTLADIDELNLKIELYSILEADNCKINIIDGEYTSDFAIGIKTEYGKNLIVTCDAQYVGNDAPTIQFSRTALTSEGGSLSSWWTSSNYKIGDKSAYTSKQWRIPQRLPYTNSIVVARISIPSGTTLKIKNINIIADNNIMQSDCGINLNAHSNSGCSAPFNTLYQAEMAAKLGYKYCIMVPKVTSDGIYVCLHDDDSIQATARNDDGSAIDTEYQNIPVSGFTYEQLLQFDFGIYRGYCWHGARIPKLEDFFAICAKTGMHPMLSVHPNLDGHWENIKAMAIRYGVLDKLNIKAPISNITYPMSVLKGDIESYTIDASASVSATAICNAFDAYKQDSTYGIENTKCVAEMGASVWTDADIETVLNRGYVCGCFSHGRDIDLVENLISKGITEFTEDYNCSVGLNW